jgi:predicted Zn-dependent protease
MNRFHYAIVVVTVLLGIGISFILIPGAAEIALINFKDNNFEAARLSYEKRLAAGDLSPSVVNPLAELYLQYGRTADAIALLERYVQANPADVEARERLGKYYAFGQRPHDYLSTLEQLTAREPSEKNLRELASIYAFHSDEDKEIGAFKKIVELYPGKPEDLLRLAKLQASSEHFEDAADTLSLMASRHADRMTGDSLQFLVGVLLDANRTDEALSRAQVWLKQHPSANGAARLAGTIALRNQIDAALALLEPFEGHAAASTELLIELTHLEGKSGRADKSLARFTALFDAKRLPHEGIEPYIELLLEVGNAKSAIQVAQSVDLALLPNWLLANLASAALASGRPDFATRIISTVGEEFLAADPMGAARFALLRGDQAGARRWLDAASQKDLTEPDRIELANLYSELKLPLETLRVLDNLRKSTGGIDVASTWAIMAAQNDRGNEALAWLNQLPPDQPSIPTLTDLYFVGQDNDERALVLAAADRLLKRNRNDENRLRYANALIRAGRVAEALPLARELVASDNNADRDSLYLAALTAARVAGQPVEAELGRYWSRKLADAGVDSARREEIVFGLLDAGASEAALPALRDLAREKGTQWLSAYKDAAIKANRKAELVEFLKTELRRTDKTIAQKEPTMFTLLETGTDTDALPFLRQFAEALGGTWNFSYEETLARNGRRDELREFWLARATRPGTSREDRYNTAVRLLEAGHKPDAERILMDLAKDNAPGGREISQLLFLWGPRPPAYGLDWIEERVRAARQPAERAQWIEYLLNAAAPQRVAALAAGDAALTDAHVRALTSIADGAGLTRVLMSQLPQINQAETLRQYARRALEVSESATARAYFAKLATLLPTDREALRWLGSLSYAAGQYGEAEAYYLRFFALNAADYESDFYFGEILLRKQDIAGANTHFERALQQIERSPTKPFEMRAVRAVTLDRVGKTAEAIAEYEALLKERPKDKNLRADFAGLLIRARRLKDAERVLSGQ